MRKSKRQRQQQLLGLLPGLRKAIELYGLPLEGNLGALLGGGLHQKTLTYLYGRDLGRTLNLLALRSVRYFDGRALFIDASNSADPFLIREETDIMKKDSASTARTLRSIQLARFFTCHQLTDFVVGGLPKLLEGNAEKQSETIIRFIAVSGVDSVFSEEDAKKSEIDRLQFLIAKTLSDVAKDKANGVSFVVASSKQFCGPLLEKSDVAIRFRGDPKTRRDVAELTKHYSRRGTTIEV
jgi:hypothetical protein